MSLLLLNSMALCNMHLGQFDEAERLLQEGLTKNATGATPHAPCCWRVPLSCRASAKRVGRVARVCAQSKDASTLSRVCPLQTAIRSRT
eukprot:6226687-Prymnesium_polylepis.1